LEDRDDVSFHKIPMPPKKKGPVWKTWGQDAAQLFRDIHFGKYQADTEVQIIHQDPARPYSQYNKSGFYKHVKTARQRVETFKTLGTGLDNEEFRKVVRLDQAPAPEDAAPNEEEESYDDTFDPNQDDESDDHLEDLDFEEESFLKNFENLSVDVPQQPTDNLSLRNHTTSKQPTDSLSMRSQTTSKSLRGSLVVPYDDGCVFVRTLLPMGCKSKKHLKLSFSSDGRQMLKKVRCPDAFKSAEQTLHGLVEPHTNCMHHHTIQAAINKFLNGEDLWEVDEVIDMPYPVCRFYLDPDGTRAKDYYVNADKNGTYWIVFWLTGIHAATVPPQQDSEDDFMMVGNARPNVQDDS
jgi:hypothetical protein